MALPLEHSTTNQPTTTTKLKLTKMKRNLLSAFMRFLIVQPQLRPVYNLQLL